MLGYLHVLSGGHNVQHLKFKMETKSKMSAKNRKILSIFVMSTIGILFLIPSVLAYPAVMPAYDLYTVFVEAVFGGFWLSVLGLAGVMFILMGPLGGLSQFTTMHYCMIFIYAMALGYTHPLFLIPMWTALMGWTVFQIFKYINSGSTA